MQSQPQIEAELNRLLEIERAAAGEAQRLINDGEYAAAQQALTEATTFRASRRALEWVVEIPPWDNGVEPLRGDY